MLACRANGARHFRSALSHQTSIVLFSTPQARPYPPQPPGNMTRLHGALLALLLCLAGEQLMQCPLVAHGRRRGETRVSTLAAAAPPGGHVTRSLCGPAWPPSRLRLCPPWASHMCQRITVRLSAPNCRPRRCNGGWHRPLAAGHALHGSVRTREAHPRLPSIQQPHGSSCIWH